MSIASSGDFYVAGVSRCGLGNFLQLLRNIGAVAVFVAAGLIRTGRHLVGLAAEVSATAASSALRRFEHDLAHGRRAAGINCTYRWASPSVADCFIHNIFVLPRALHFTCSAIAGQVRGATKVTANSCTPSSEFARCA